MSRRASPSTRSPCTTCASVRASAASRRPDRCGCAAVAHCCSRAATRPRADGSNWPTHGRRTSTMPSAASTICTRCLPSSVRATGARASSSSAPAHAHSRPTRHGKTTRLLGLPACRALIAFGRGDDTLAITLLASLPAQAHRLGGSHAQRDVLHLTLRRAVERVRRPKGGPTTLARRRRSRSLPEPASSARRTPAPSVPRPALGASVRL